MYGYPATYYGDVQSDLEAREWRRASGEASGYAFPNVPRTRSEAIVAYVAFMASVRSELAKLAPAERATARYTAALILAQTLGNGAAYRFRASSIAQIIGSAALDLGRVEGTQRGYTGASLNTAASGLRNYRTTKIAYTMLGSLPASAQKAEAARDYAPAALAPARAPAAFQPSSYSPPAALAPAALAPAVEATGWEAIKAKPWFWPAVAVSGFGALAVVITLATRRSA